MTTLSIPLPPDLAKYVEEQAKESGLSRAALVRQALKQYRDEQAIQEVLRAAAEPTIEGDFDELLSKA